MEFKHFKNLYGKQQNFPCLWNWIAKLNCEWRIIVKSWKAFHLASQWFCLCEVSETKVMLSFNLLAIFTIKCNDSVDSSQLSLNKLGVQHLMHPNIPQCPIFILILHIRRNPLGNWVIFIFSGQKPCTTQNYDFKYIAFFFYTFLD